MSPNNEVNQLLERYEKVIELGREINRGISDHQTLFNQLCVGVADIMGDGNTLLLAIHRPQIDMLDLYCQQTGRQVAFQERDFYADSLCARVLREKRTLTYHHRTVEAPGPMACIVAGTESTPDTESLIFVPLMVRESALGVLSLQHIEPDKYTAEDVRIMEMIGNQVGLALSSQRLYRYLKGLNSAAEQLTQQLEQRQLLQDVVNRIKETTWADLAILFPYHKKEKKFGEMYYAGKFVRPDNVTPDVQRDDDLAWLVLGHEGPVYIKDSTELYTSLGGDAGKKRLGNFEQREGIKSVVALPLLVNNEKEGVLFVNFRHEQRFDDPQKQLINGLASIAAIAIKNSRTLHGVRQQRSDDLEALQSIASEINRTYELDKMLEIILQKAQERLAAGTEASILLYSSATKSLEVKKWLGAYHKDLTGLKLYAGDDVNGEGAGLSVWAFRNGKTVRLNNVRTDKLPNGRLAKDYYYEAVEGTVSEMDIPLQNESNVPFGVISLESNEESAFTEDAEKFLRNLAEQSVTAIKHAQNLKEIRQKADELETILNVEKKIISRLDAKELLQEILNEALQLTGSDAGQVCLHHKERKDFSLEAHRGVPPERENERFPDDKGILGYVLQNPETFNNNVCKLPWKKIYHEMVQGICWELAVPIMQGNEVLGIINIEKPEDPNTSDINPFTRREEHLLENLAALATIGLQNAKDYRRSEHNRKVLDALHRIDSHIIAQEKDADEAMFFILERARELVNNAERGSLHITKKMAPLSAKSPSLTGYYRGDEEMGSKPVFTPDYRKDEKLGIVKYVLKNKKPYRTGNASNDEYYLGPKDILSELAVPLFSKGKKLLGVLNLESPREYAFGEDDQTLLELFAGQALVAILNAHNYNDAAEQKSRFESLLETARELGEIVDLSQLTQAYDIILDKAIKHSESEVIIRRYNEANRELVKVAIRNERAVPPPETISVDKPSTNAQVFRDRQTKFIPDTKNPPPGIEAPVALVEDINALLITPISFDKKNYYGNLIFSHEEPYFFKESDIKLVEGLAKQLAVTLHRLEATQERKETADKLNKLAAVKDMESSAYQLTHRLGNDLGLVESYVNNIREELAGARIDNLVLNEQLDRVVQDTSQVLRMSTALKEKVAKMDARRAELLPVIELLPKPEEWSPLPPIPSHITLKIEINESLREIQVKVVHGQITEILHTLVSNSIEAMPKGGEIALNAFLSDNNVSIVVVDNGPGIPRSAHKNIFHMFYSTKGGSGYGLWSARRYAQLNGGDLMLDEQFTKGAKFILTLPAFGLSDPTKGRS